MAKGWKNKSVKGAELQIAEHEVRKRGGFIKLAGGFAAFIVVAVVHTTVIINTGGDGDNLFFRAIVYLSALVCAGFAGYGARDIYRANNAIRDLRATIEKKSKKSKNK
ncbi:MAG: hypothetical protein IKV48_03020 [Eggerthellaceae bacterium]|nr:hypothetical protein [Eggerthellaceae bacterium]